jgi:hypothetical protein
VNTTTFKSEKVCKECGLLKPRSAYYTNGRGRPGSLLKSIRPECKECNIRGTVARDRMNPSSVRRRNLKYVYGLDRLKYEEMLAKQKGLCAICVGLPGVRALGVDHDHATGLIRGLLCSNCNRGIGHFKDKPELLREAAEYLERARCT